MSTDRVDDAPSADNRVSGVSARQGQSSAAERRSSAPTPSTESLAWWAILGAVALVPIAITDLTWLGFELPLTADIYIGIKVALLRLSAVFALACWAWSVLVQGRRVRVSPADRLVAAFLGFLAVSTAFSMHVPTSVAGQYGRSDGLLTYLTYGVFYFLVVQLVDRAERVAQLARALVWPGIAISLYGIAQYLGFEVVSVRSDLLAGRALSTLGNPAILGNHLVFVLPVSCSLAISEKRTAWRAFYWGGALLSTIALTVTFTRSAWIGAAVACLLLAGYGLFKRAPMRLSVDVPVAFLVLASLGFLVARRAPTGASVPSVAARAADLLQFGAGSGLTRVEIWKAAWLAAMERPLTGFGLDTFRLASARFLSKSYVAAAEYRSLPDNAHSYPLQLAATAGIPAVILFGWTFGTIAWLSAKRLLLPVRAPLGTTAALMAGMWAASAGYIVNLLAGISMPYTTVLLWVSAGVLIAPLAKAKELRRVLRGPAVAVATVCVALAVLSVVPLYADRAFMKSRVSEDPSQRVAFADAAVALAPLNSAYRTFGAAAYAEAVLGRLRAAGGSVRDPQIRAAFDSALARLEAAHGFSPSEHDTNLFLLIAYVHGGRYVDDAYYSDAVRTAERALREMPNIPTVLFQYAVALEGVGRSADARARLEEVVRLEPRMGEAAVELARLYAASGDTEGAIEVLRDAEPRVLNKQLVEGALQALERGETPPAAW